MSRDLHIELAETPHARRLPWEAMETEGIEHIVLWNRLHPTILDWLDNVNPLNCVLLNFWDEDSGDYIGAIWVGPILGKAGCMHFFICKKFRPEVVDLGRQAIDSMFHKLNLACMWVFSPASYRHLSALMRELGFESMGRLPGACHMPTVSNPSRHLDGIINKLTPDNFYKAGRR